MSTELSGQPAAALSYRAEVKISARESMAVAALLLLVLGTVYWNVIFQGKSLVNSDNSQYIDHAMVEDQVPSEVWESRGLLPTTNFHDTSAAMFQWESGGEFFRQGLLRGEWPLWDPYVAAGAPSMANLTPTFFFPPYTLMVLLGNTSVLKNIYFLLYLLAAGFFTYLCLRKHVLSREASFFGAISYMLCGAITQNAASFIGQTLACLPVAVYVTRRFLDRPTWTRSAVVAVTYAAISLSSFPPLLVAIFGFSAFYGIWMICASDNGTLAGMNRWQLAGRFAIAVGLSLGLVAFYYFPIFDLLIQPPPQVPEHYHDGGLKSLRLFCCYELVAPALLDDSAIYKKPVMDLRPCRIYYIGIIPVLAALLAGRTQSARGRALLGVTLAAVVFLFLKLLGAAPAQWIALLPGFNRIHFSAYFSMPLGFLFALLGALGLENLRAGGVTPTRAWIAFASGATILLNLRQFATDRGALNHPQATRWLSDWWMVTLLMLCAAALLIIGAWLSSRRLRGVRGIIVALIGLFFLEGLHNTAYPRQIRRDAWRHPGPMVEKLMQETGIERVFNAGTFFANQGSAFEIFSLDSLMTFNPPRIHQLYHEYARPQRAEVKRERLFLRGASQIPPEGVLDRANIGYLVARSPAVVREAKHRGYETRLAGSGFSIFRRQSSPRYFFTSTYRVLTPTAALAAIGSMAPGREVILETAPPFASQPNRDTDPEVEILELNRNSYTLTIDAPRPGLIYCSESFFRGWRALVNGRPTPILPANFAFRAVAVPAGQVVLELSYWPPGLTPGLIVTAITAALLLALLWWDRRHGKIAAAVGAAPSGITE